MFDRKRMEKSLKGTHVNIPKGMTKEELRQFILRGGR